MLRILFVWLFFITCASARSAIFLSDSRLHSLKRRLSARVEPNFSAWQQMHKRCVRGLSHRPHPVERWSVPGFYDGPAAYEQAVLGLQQDASLAYEEALCYRLSDDVRFGSAAGKILEAWANTLKSADLNAVDSKLSMCEQFPAMIGAADLLQNYAGWPAAKQFRFKDLVRDVVLPLNTMFPKINNHANWGTLLVLSAATYLQDEALFEKGALRFKDLINIQIDASGILRAEFDRSDTNDWHGGPTRGKRGIWYTHYALMPTTLSAELLRLNGRDFYNYTAPKGGSLKAAFENAAQWARHPETFPFYKSNRGKLLGLYFVSYMEILNLHWPNVDAQELLGQHRPLSADSGLPDLTLTHGDF